MKIEVNCGTKFTAQYMKSILARTIQEVSSNPVLKEFVKTGDSYTYYDPLEQQTVEINAYHDMADAAVADCGSHSAIEVSLPNPAKWDRDDACSPLGVVEVPDWVSFLIAKEFYGSNPAWLVALGANYVRADVLANLFGIPVEDLLALKFVAPDGKELTAISCPSWDFPLTSASLVDFRAVLVAMILNCNEIG